MRPKGKPRGRVPVARTFGARVAWQPPTRQQQVLEAMQRIDRPADHRQVADMLGIDQARASSALRRLTAKGLLERHRTTVTRENPGLCRMLGRPYQFRGFEVWSYRLTEAGRATERLPDPKKARCL